MQSCLLWCTGPNAKGLKRAIQTHSTAFEKRVMQSVVGGQGFQKKFQDDKKACWFLLYKELHGVRSPMYEQVDSSQLDLLSRLALFTSTLLPSSSALRVYVLCNLSSAAE